MFNDPKLNALIEQAYTQNLDVRTAGTRILAARATRNIAAGNLFPQLQEAFADISRNAASGATAANRGRAPRSDPRQPNDPANPQPVTDTRSSPAIEDLVYGTRASGRPAPARRE